MSPIAKNASPELGLPDRVNSEVWKHRVKSDFKGNKLARSAFDAWSEHVNRCFVKSGVVDTDHLMEIAYRLTRPPQRSSIEQDWHEAAVERINDLQPLLERTIDALERSGSKIVAKDGVTRYELRNLLTPLKQAATEVGSAVGILNRPYMREPDVLRYCIGFFSDLQRYGIEEPKAVQLCSVLMRGHGFLAGQLEVFSQKSIDSGRIRKRLKSYRATKKDVAEDEAVVRRVVNAVLTGH